MPRSTSLIGSTRRALTHSALRASVAAIALASGLGSGARAAAVSHGTPAPSMPQIYSVQASPRIAHAGDSIKWDAHVSLDVVTVTARVAVYSFSLYPLSAGHFGETFTIPKDVPPFFHGRYTVTLTATNSVGATASHAIVLRFQ